MAVTEAGFAAVAERGIALAPPAGAPNLAGEADSIGPFGGTTRSFDTAYDPMGDRIAMADMTNYPWGDHRAGRPALSPVGIDQRERERCQACTC